MIVQREIWGRTLVSLGETDPRVAVVDGDQATSTTGYVDTEMIRSGFREGTLNEAELLRRTPSGRLAQADDIASAIAFLLGHDSRFVRGVTLKVDGGITIDGSFN